MNILSALEKENSKAMAVSITEYVGDNSRRMEELMQCFFSDVKRICQRASWPMSFIAEKHPHLIIPYLKRMFEGLKNPKHNAEVRNTIRIVSMMEVPEEMEGDVYETCYNYLNDPKAAIAFRVFSMSACVNIAMKYPDLKEELIATIREHLPHGSAGFIARGKREIAKMLK